MASLMFGAIGGLNLIRFLTEQSSSGTAVSSWAGALGLAIAVNSLYWLFAWRPGTFKRVGPASLALALLLSTYFALYIGCRAFTAHSLGIGLTDL